jgi:hypothetical protein
MFSLGDSYPSARAEEKAKNYGADLSTLVRMIERGEI